MSAYLESADTLTKSIPLFTKKSVQQNRFMRASQKQCKKAEKRTRLFDFRTKIYTPLQLKSEKLFTASEEHSAKDADRDTIPEMPEPDGILERIKNTEIIGMGGGGFSAIQKLNCVLNAKTEKKYFLINAVECDPGLLHDGWLLRNCRKEIQSGISAVCKCISFDRVILASKQDSQSFDNSKLEQVQTDFFYPLGEEHFLIRQLLGIDLQKSDIPAEHGVLVFNVQTVLQIGEAVMQENTPKYRYLTVANLYDATAVVAKAEIGTNAKSILQSAFGAIPNAEAWIGTDSMHCFSLANRDEVSMRTAFLAYAPKPDFHEPISCIGCGTCQKKCPLHLPIAGIMKAGKFGISIPKEVSESCISCNACTYFCRAGIQTASYMKQNKQERIMDHGPQTTENKSSHL